MNESSMSQRKRGREAGGSKKKAACVSLYRPWGDTGPKTPPVTGKARTR